MTSLTGSLSWETLCYQFSPHTFMSVLCWELENMPLNTLEGSSSEINCCTRACVYSLLLTEILALDSKAGRRVRAKCHCLHQDGEECFTEKISHVWGLEMWGGDGSCAMKESNKSLFLYLTQLERREGPRWAPAAFSDAATEKREAVSWRNVLLHKYSNNTHWQTWMDSVWQSFMSRAMSPITTGYWRKILIPSSLHFSFWLLTWTLSRLDTDTSIIHSLKIKRFLYPPVEHTPLCATRLCNSNVNLKRYNLALSEHLVM